MFALSSMFAWAQSLLELKVCFELSVCFELNVCFELSVCFELLMIGLFLFLSICVYDENLQYHMNDFMKLTWYKAVTLILSYVLFSVNDFDPHTIRASYLFDRRQPSGWESEICIGLWHSSIPFYCLNTVDVLWAGLWVAVLTAPGARSSYTIPKDPTTRVWIWNTWQAVT